MRRQWVVADGRSPSTAHGGRSARHHRRGHALALNQVQRAMLNATAELLLIAPEGVRKLAADLTDGYLGYVTAAMRGASLGEPAEPAGQLQNQLFGAMRANLGQSVEPAGS